MIGGGKGLMVKQVVSKQSIYFNNGEHIVKLKAKGKDGISYMEMETSSGNFYKCGRPPIISSTYDFDIPPGCKLLSF